MVDWEKLGSPGFWGSFKIPAFAFAVVALILLFRNTAEGAEFIYAQMVANYALGASIYFVWSSVVLDHGFCIRANNGQLAVTTKIRSVN